MYKIHMKRAGSSVGAQSNMLIDWKRKIKGQLFSSNYGLSSSSIQSYEKEVYELTSIHSDDPATDWIEATTA